MLTRLSAAAHEVKTAVLIAKGDSKDLEFSYDLVSTKVYFRDLHSDEIERLYTNK